MIPSHSHNNLSFEVISDIELLFDESTGGAITTDRLKEVTIEYLKDL